MLFASSGFVVEMFDVELSRVDEALADIRRQLTTLDQNGLLRGQLTVDEQHSLIHRADTLGQCLSGAYYVQVQR